MIARDEGAFEEAERYFEEGLALRREVGRAWDMAISLRHMGDAALGQGKVEAAARWYTESVHTFRCSPDRYGIEAAVAGLGETCLAQGDAAGARQHLRTAVRAAALAGDNAEALKILTGIGSLLIDTGRDELAAGLLAAVVLHPTSTWATRSRAERLLGVLSARLPAETLAQAHLAGPDLDTVVAQVLEEL